MNQRPALLALTAVCLFAAGAPRAADTGSLGGDLQATIVLQGKPCDKIVDSKRNGDSDYTATCNDGNRYHVFLNAQGRVVVDKL